MKCLLTNFITPGYLEKKVRLVTKVNVLTLTEKNICWFSRPYLGQVRTLTMTTPADVGNFCYSF